LLNGHLYGIDGDQNSRCSLKCVSLKDGKEVWAEKSIGFGSLMAADGRLIILTEKGELVIAKASTEKFEEINRRFEEIDRRFEEIDRRLDAIEARMRFMIASGLTIGLALFGLQVQILLSLP
jgi:tetrahydromethanopterin S-methyltransferase subunit G